MEHRQSYIGGINQDLSKVKDRSKYIFSMENGRLFTKDTTNIGDVQNVKGNIDISIRFTSPYEDTVIIGFGEINNDLILITTLAGAASPDCLWRVPITYTGNIPFAGTPTLLFSGDLNLSVDYPIYDNTITRYETNEVQHFYWVDNNNPYRHANIADDLTGVGNTYFDVISSITFSTPTVSDVMQGGGVFKSGLVQYAYYMYKKHGNRTIISPVSAPVHLVPDNDKIGNTSEYVGCANDSDVYKSIEVRITYIDPSYDYLRLYRIHYTDQYQDPEINEIYDGPVGTYFSKIDTGDSLGTLTTEEFNLLTTFFGAKTIEAKDDLMVAGNVFEDIFDIGDFDSRIYRANAAGHVYLKHTDGTYADYTYSLLNIINGVNTIESDHDCINPYNDLQNEIDQQALPVGTGIYDRYIYRHDGNVVGGSGINVDFKIETHQLVEDATANSPNLFANAAHWYQINSFSNYANPLYSGLYRSYMIDETYRFAIVWIDDKGRKSFPQWMCDIRMPKQYAASTTWSDFRIYYYDGISKGYLRALDLQFNIKNYPTNAVAYEIVRCERTENDATTVSMGMLGSPTNDILPVPGNGGGLPSSRPFYMVDWYDTVYDMFEYQCPEVAFGKLDYRNGDYLAIIGGYMNQQNNVDAVNHHEVSKWDEVTSMNIERHYYMGAAPTTHHTILPIYDAKVLQVGGEYIHDTTPTRYVANEVFIGSLNNGYRRLCGALTTTIGRKMFVGGAYTYQALYKRILTQYGGNTYAARSNNEYISTNSYHNISASTVNTYLSVFGGDTFTSQFEYIRFFGAVAGTDNCVVNIFPVMTTINLALRYDEQYHENERRINLSETDDMYLYDHTFSRQSEARVYVAEPLVLNDSVRYYNRLRYSLSKIDGELIDNWTIFLPNNMQHLEGGYGQIQKLVSFKNSIFAFQDTAICQLSINEQALISNNISQIVLGTGGVLENYNYVTRTSGTRHPQSIIKTDKGVFYYDSTTKEIKGLSSEDNSVSTIKGIASKIAKLPDWLSDEDNMLSGTGYGVCGAYDRGNEEILFSFSYVDPTVQYSAPSLWVAPTIDNSIIDNGLIRVYADTEMATTGLSKDIEIGDYLIFIRGTNEIRGKVICMTTDGFKCELDSIPTITSFVPTGWNIRHDIKNNYTIVYSENANSFCSFDTYIPSFYINNKKNLFSIPNPVYSTLYTDGLISGNPTMNKMYIHGYGDRGKWYDDIYDTKIEVIANPLGDVLKQYSNIEFLSEVYSSTGVNLSDVTIDRIRMSNDYQHTGLAELTSGSNIKRRMRKWRYTIPRSYEYIYNQSDTYPNTVGTTSLARLRNSDLKIDMIFNNDNNYSLYLRDLFIYFLAKQY